MSHAALESHRVRGLRRGVARERRGGGLPLWLALLLAVGAGALLAMAFPSPSWWWAAAPAVAGIVTALRGRTVRGSFLVALVAGEAFYLTLITWATAFLGALPWIALATLEALFFAVGGVLVTLALRWAPRRRALRLAVLPLVVAALWVLRELNANAWPYRGFAWGRVGQSQADGPFVELVSWLGLSGTGFVVVAIGAALAQLAWELRDRVAWRVVPRAAGAWAAAAVVLALVPAYRLPVTGTLAVAGVQGGTPQAGFFVPRRDGQVRAAHVAATRLIEVQRSEPVDLVVWPEGAAEPDPLVDAPAAADLRDLQRRLRAPFLVGAINQDPDGRLFNSAQLWVDGSRVARYDKRDPVPFGEYVPDRALWARFAPNEIGLITREYAFGTTSPVLSVGSHRVGVGICFDVIDDELARESVRDGADALVYPTNNADFARTDELAQQLAFARLRAIETGRSVIQVSTVGFTEAYAPDGRSLGRLPWYTQGSLVVDLPTTTGTTPAVLLARPLELALAALGVLALAALGAAARRGRPATGDHLGWRA